MSTTVHAPSPADDFSDFEFAAIVADFDREPSDTPAGYRLSRAAERREARQQINVQLGIHRHRTGERRD